MCPRAESLRIPQLCLPLPAQVDTLYCGEVGYLAAQIKSVKDARVGDTVTQRSAPADEPLAGYMDVQPMVYCGLFPSNSDDYQDLREALGKLQLNDAALKYEPEVNNAMGFGFRCGFLGLLHMEFVQVCVGGGRGREFQKNQPY